MKNFNQEENYELQSVHRKIRSIFKVLQKEQISTEDYPILLLLLCLYKDGTLNDSFLNHIEREKEFYRKYRPIPSSGRDFSKNFGGEYTMLIAFYFRAFEHLGPESLKEITEFIYEIDPQILSIHFETIFNKVLHYLDSTNNSVEHHLDPVGLTELMISLSHIKKSDVIYNPFAGLASFGLAEKEVFYVGQEINEKVWNLGALRLIAFDRFTHYLREDSIDNWPVDSRKFDLIISSPPLSLEIDSQYIKSEFYGTFKTGEQFVIERSLNNLKKTGKLVIQVTSRFLNGSPEQKKIITHLLDNDLIESIIPFQNNAVMVSSVLVINMLKKKPGKIAMYNTAKFVQKKNDWETEFNFNELIDFVKENKEDNEVVKLVDNEEIRNNDLILNTPRYFRKEIEGVKLREILFEIKGETVKTPLNEKVIQIINLKEKDIDFSIDLSKAKETISKRTVVDKISESCLLIATRWISLKPSFFNYSGTPLFKVKEILACKVDESKVDIPYLIHELNSEYIAMQIDSLRLSTVIPTIRVKDFLDIKIKLPSLEEQKAMALGALLAYKKAKIDTGLLEDELESIKAKFNEELREKQHCIRQHLKNVVDSIAVINSFMDKQNGTINRKDVINPNRNVTVAQRFEAMSNSLQSLRLEIDNLTNDELYDKPEKIGIRDIISDCILEFGDTKGFSIHESFDEFVLDEYGDINPKFSVSKRSFKELFNNIVMNASLHGFIETKECIIKIGVTIEEGKLKVTFLNNGKPLADGMREHLGVKGKKAGINAGSGIGVSKVIEIANHYGFEHRIIDIPEDEYPFGWEFKFTLTELN